MNISIIERIDSGINQHCIRNIKIMYWLNLSILHTETYSTCDQTQSKFGKQTLFKLSAYSTVVTYGGFVVAKS